MNKRKGRSTKLSHESEKAEACLIDWLHKLARHHRTTLEQPEIDIYLNAFRNKTEYQINVACLRALTEIQFMPKIAELAQRMPEQAHSEHYRGYVQKKPILDVVRDIAIEITPALIGMEYKTVYKSEDDRLRSWCCFNANVVRYIRLHKITTGYLNPVPHPSRWLGTSPDYLGVAVNMSKLEELAALRTQTYSELTGLDDAEARRDPTQK